jgi:hypothetical protein
MKLPLNPTPFIVKTILCLFFIVIGFNSAITTYKLFNSLFVSGPNTIGEGGKVYYAHRFQSGKSIFSNGASPPYYPAVHGALLHASIGFLGKIFSLSINQLFIAGRVVSLLCSLLSIIFAALILRSLNLGPLWFWLALIVYIAPYQVQQHAVSYRPDNWILFLAVLACYLRIKLPTSHLSYFALICIPLVAFLIKAPGVYICGAVIISFWFQHQWKVGFGYGLITVIIFGIIIIFLQILSKGAFLDAFFSGMSVKFSLNNSFSTFISTYIWIPILLPAFIIRQSSNLAGNGQEKLSVIFSFWLVSLIGGFLFSTRTGSAAYYFLDSYTFGSILFIYWLASTVSKNFLKKAGFGLTICALIIMLILQTLWNLHNSVAYIDIAVTRAERFAKDRSELANWVNSKHWQCYSDDPGLNVLLDYPFVILPMTQSILIDSGALEINTLLEPVIRQEHDIIILTGKSWSYRGISNLPSSFFEEVRRNYEVTKIKPETNYVVMLPKSRKDLISRKFNMF